MKALTELVILLFLFLLIVCFTILYLYVQHSCSSKQSRCSVLPSIVETMTKISGGCPLLYPNRNLGSFILFYAPTALKVVDPSRSKMHYTCHIIIRTFGLGYECSTTELTLLGPLNRDGGPNGLDMPLIFTLHEITARTYSAMLAVLTFKLHIDRNLCNDLSAVKLMSLT